MGGGCINHPGGTCHAARFVRSLLTASSNNKLDEEHRKGFDDLQRLCDDTVISIERSPCHHSERRLFHSDTT